MKNRLLVRFSVTAVGLLVTLATLGCAGEFASADKDVEAVKQRIQREMGIAVATRFSMINEKLDVVEFQFRAPDVGRVSFGDAVARVKSAFREATAVHPREIVVSVRSSFDGDE